MKTLTVKIDDKYYQKEFPDERGLKVLSKMQSGRGFVGAAFEDLYGQQCSIQNSSLATEGAIWIGVENTGPHLSGPNGKFNEQVDARMHLSRKQVEELLPILHAFVEKAHFEKSDIPEKIRG